MVQYQRIKYFLVAAETLNFTEAANKVYVSSQAIAKQIALLEIEFGVKLFERTTRNMKLTREGEISRDLFSKIDVQIEKAISEIKSMGEKKTDKIVIGLFSGLSRQEITMPLINKIKDRYPDHALEFIVEDIILMKENLQNGKFDLCITYIAREEKLEGMKTARIASYPAKIVVSKKHPWAMKDKISIEDMKQMTILGFIKKEEPGVKSFYEKLPSKEKVLVPNFDTMLAYLEMNNAFAVFPETFEQMNHQKYKYFDLPGQSQYMDVVCFCLKDHKKKIIPHILNLIREEFILK